jgi:hypothetical protein
LIAAEDAWFDGFQENLTVLARLIDELVGSTIHVWPLEGRLIATRCTPERWGQLLDIAQATVEREASEGVTQSDARVLVGAVAVADGVPDLARALWEKLEPTLHFIASNGGDTRLVSIGRGMRPALAAILDESDRPLHMNEIVERMRERGYIARDDSSVRNTIRNVVREADGVLYGRSLYGLAKHAPIEADVADEALAELEEVIENGIPGRQWHCSELADELVSRRPDLGEDIDQYVVNVIMRRSASATYLGRLIWVGSRRSDDQQDRLDVMAMCEAALLRAGRPLTKRELRDEIQQVRGLNRTFLPQASERVIRLAHGRWGLADRDVGVSAENQKAALSALFQCLENRQKGLHVSELFPALDEIGFTPDPELDQWELLGIAQADARFRVGRGQIVGRASWADLRRRSIRQAFADLRETWQGPITSESLYNAVCSAIERVVARSTVIAHAPRAGFAYDASSGFWNLAAQAPTAGVSEDDDE